MFRKFGIGLTALAMLAPGFVSALGVGDYRLNSYLNQPLSMEVQLFDAGDLTTEELLVNLGAERDFENAGVERVFFLNELNFEVDLKPNGDGILRITSNQPVREPFLNFIIELMWPTGRLLREYTVLLDPPSFAEPVSRPLAPPAAVQSVAPAPAQTAAPAQPASQPRVATQTRDLDTRRGPDYVVQNSDTLWRIALNNRPVTSISVQQMLIAIQQLNPDAFIDGNVNLVREGTVLRMPTEAEIRNISARNAIAQVAEQNREWRAKLEARGIALPSRTQLDGTGTGRTDRAAGGVSEGQVTLLSPDAVSGTGTGRGTAGAGSADASALQNELAIRDENMDRMNRENRELSSRLKDLQEQVSTSERLLKLRNDQIAQLQQQLNELQKAQGITPSEPIVIEPVVEAPVAVTGEGEVATANGEVATPVEGEVLAEGEATSEPAVAEVAPVAAPERPRVVTPPAAQPTLMDTLMANLLYIVAGLLVLAAVVGGMVFMRNRQKAGQVEDEFAESDESDAGDDDFFASAQDFGDDDEQDDEATSAASESAQDPLEEVDVYTAYGRHAEAVNFLRNEIHKAPQRDDLKVRLLEVLAEMHDRDGFEREAASYAGAGAAVAAAISSLRGRLGGGEQEPSLDDLEMDLASDFDAPVVKPSAAAPLAEQELSLGDEEDFGSLDFSLDDDKPAAAAPVLATDDDEISLDLGGDDELSLDMDSDDAMSLDDDDLSLDLDDDKTTTSAALSLDDDDDLELSLDDDSELSLDLDDAPAATSRVALDDISADLDDDVDFGELSLTDVSDEFSEAAVKPSSEEIDLSLDDLSLDELDEPTAVSMPAVQPAATVQRDALDLDMDELSLDDEPTMTSAPVSAPASAATPAALEQALTGDDDDFDFLGDTDENATKLDLAKAYIDMGDSEGAKDILQEVISEGNPQQQQEAKELLAQVG
ncbi:MAG: FimV/HubP family polar landmark protein [Alcanivoracaceae bacterium]